MQRKFSHNPSIKALRARLPRNYAKHIATRMGNITPREVSYVFAERLTDATLVKNVLEATDAYMKDLKKINFLKNRLKNINV